MSNDEGLIAGFQIDAEGRCQHADFSTVPPEDGMVWLHLEFTNAAAYQWLVDESGIDPIVRNALTAEETRPRTLTLDGGIMLILRGLNLNPGADPEDMVALRMWMDGRRVVSMERRKLMAVRDLIADCENDRAPKSPAETVYRLSRNLADRMEPSIDNLDDELDALEEVIVDNEISYELRTQITALRRRAVRLRRFIAPQREALMKLLVDDETYFSERMKHRMREVGERTTRYVEEIDETRDRTQILYDDLSGRLSERMERNMYVLSVVAAIFLPLSLLTGLLGINVDGMPGAQDAPFAFWAVTLGLVGAGIIEYLIVRRLRWL